jgi:hypothetical protein
MLISKLLKELKKNHSENVQTKNEGKLSFSTVISIYQRFWPLTFLGDIFVNFSHDF